MRRTLLATGLVALLACRSAPSPGAPETKTWSVPQADPSLPSALEILARHVQATGMRAVIEGSESVYVLGSVQLSGEERLGEFEAWRARPARSAMRVWLPTQGESRYGCDGTHGWLVDPRGPHVLDGADLWKARASAVYDHLLRRPEGLETYVTVARQRFEGHECFELFGLYAEPAGTDPALRSFREYYDAGTGLLVAVVERSGSSAGEVEVTRVFEDYEPLGGSLVARRSVQRSAGHTLVFAVEEVRYDSVDDEVFEMPSSVAALLGR